MTEPLATGAHRSIFGVGPTFVLWSVLFSVAMSAW